MACSCTCVYMGIRDMIFHHINTFASSYLIARRQLVPSSPSSTMPKISSRKFKAQNFKGRVSNPRTMTYLKFTMPFFIRFKFWKLAVSFGCLSLPRCSGKTALCCRSPQAGGHSGQSTWHGYFLSAQSLEARPFRSEGLASRIISRLNRIPTCR